MAQFRVGCVPFVNARPLVAAFDAPNDWVEVVYDVPSKLPALLDSGEVDAILVSSVELLRRDDLVNISDVGIMSNGPVMSVRLLSKVGVSEIKTLALDSSSMTSNMLAQVLLAEIGVFPTCDAVPPVQEDMLANHDACVLIGDRGLEADGDDLIDIDLGSAWTDLTSLPFVWALWLGKRGSSKDLSLLGKVLEAAYASSRFSALHEYRDQARPQLPGFMSSLMVDPAKPGPDARRDYVIQSAAERSGWDEEQVEDYLANGVRFEHAKYRESLARFAELISKHELAAASVSAEFHTDRIRKEIDVLMETLSEQG